MKTRGVRGDMLDGFEGGFFCLLQVTEPCRLLGTSEIPGLPRKFALLMEGPDFHDIRGSQHGICSEHGESHAMGAHIERETLNVPITPQVAQHLHKFLRTRKQVFWLQLPRMDAGVLARPERSRERE